MVPGFLGILRNMLSQLSLICIRVRWHSTSQKVNRSRSHCYMSQAIFAPSLFDICGLSVQVDNHAESFTCIARTLTHHNLCTAVRSCEVGCVLVGLQLVHTFGSHAIASIVMQADTKWWKPVSFQNDARTWEGSNALVYKQAFNGRLAHIILKGPAVAPPEEPS